MTSVFVPRSTSSVGRSRLVQTASRPRRHGVARPRGCAPSGRRTPVRRVDRQATSRRPGSATHPTTRRRTAPCRATPRARPPTSAPSSGLPAQAAIDTSLQGCRPPADSRSRDQIPESLADGAGQARQAVRLGDGIVDPRDDVRADRSPAGSGVESEQRRGRRGDRRGPPPATSSRRRAASPSGHRASTLRRRDQLGALDRHTCRIPMPTARAGGRPALAATPPGCAWPPKRGRHAVEIRLLHLDRGSASLHVPHLDHRHAVRSTSRSAPNDLPASDRTDGGTSIVTRRSTTSRQASRQPSRNSLSDSRSRIRGDSAARRRRRSGSGTCRTSRASRTAARRTMPHDAAA